MFLTLFARTLLLYLVVLLVLRLMGKREVGQLSTFDLVVAIMIAEVAVIPMEEPERPLYYGLVPLLTLVGAEILISYFCLKSRFLRNIVDGSPSVVVANGKILEKEMRRQRYSVNDLLSQLREKNIFNVADVEFAILETSGELSVIVKPEKRLLTLEDLNIKPGNKGIPTPLIIDGELLTKNLELLKLSEKRLEEELEARGINGAANVLFASIDVEGVIYISEKNVDDEIVTDKGTLL